MKIKKMEKEEIIKIILKIAFSIMLLITFTLIGSPIKNQVIYPIYISIDIVAIICIFIQKPWKGINSLTKIDIAVIVLCLSSLIPLIFKTYVSLDGTVIKLIKYIHILFCYFNAKCIIKVDPKNKEYIIKNIIIIICALTIIGIDLMTFQFFTPIAKVLGIQTYLGEEIRMSSLFYYANTFAIVLAVALVIAIGEFLYKGKQKSKLIYVALITLLITGIILSYSRITYVLLICVLIFYIIYLKDRFSRIQTVLLLLNTGIAALIYSILFMKWLGTKQYLLIWTFLPVMSIFSIIMQIIIDKFKTKIEKITIKQIIILSLIILIVVVTYIIIGLQMKGNLKFFNERGRPEEKVIEIYNVKPNQKYNIELDINAISKYKQETIFEIGIQEKSKFFDDIKYTPINFGEFKGKKKIEIQATETTEQLFIKFRSRIANENVSLEINHLWVNGKEIVLKYKILPTNLVNKLKNINLQTKSAWERLVFIQDGLKIIKQHWLFGIGGNGWRYTYPNVQHYKYDAKEVHSYPIQTWLEDGIIAFITFGILVIFLIKSGNNYWKTSDIQNKSIIVSIGVILLHSCVDFDMSFYSVLLLVFVLIAIVDLKNGKVKKTRKGIGIFTTMLFLGIIGLSLSYDYILYNFQMKSQTKDYENVYSFFNKYEPFIPYSKSIKNARIQILAMSNKDKDMLIKDIKWMIENERYFYYDLEMNSYLFNIALQSNKLEDIQNCIDIAKKIRDDGMMSNYNEGYQLKKLNNINQIAIKIEEVYKKTNIELWKDLEDIYNNIILEQSDKIKKYVSDYKNCRYPKEKADNYINDIDMIQKETENRISMKKVTV